VTGRRRDRGFSFVQWLLNWFSDFFRVKFDILKERYGGGDRGLTCIVQWLLNFLDFFRVGFDIVQERRRQRQEKSRPE
jgi:hypothetical protein